MAWDFHKMAQGREGGQLLREKLGIKNDKKMDC
jgi:hypothetical protein